MFCKNYSFLFILGLLSIFLLSGCTDLAGAMIDLDLVTGDDLTSFEEDFLNVTSMDLSNYPTLEKCILKILNPNNNITGVFEQISEKEMNLINSELLHNPELDNDWYNYIAFGEFLFWIGFAVA